MMLILTSGCGLPNDETAGETMQDNEYTIEKIQDCGTQEANNQAKLTLFDHQNNRLYGWSHIMDGPKEFDGLKLTAADYKVSAANSQTDPTCNNNTIFQTVLVKKYADWDRQHLNGIEPQFLYEGITFGQVESIVLELKVNSAASSFLTSAELKTLYGGYLTDEQLAAWDTGKVNLGITLFEKGFDNQSTPSFTGAIIIEIDPEKYADQWLRLTIPAANLTYFEEMNYAPTPANLDDFAGNTILGLRINPETKNGSVIRSYLQDDFDDTVPENFKEMALSFAKVEIVLK
jgi:hypothetical protein